MLTTFLGKHWIVFGLQSSETWYLTHDAQPVPGLCFRDSLQSCETISQIEFSQVNNQQLYPKKPFVLLSVWDRCPAELA